MVVSIDDKCKQTWTIFLMMLKLKNGIAWTRVGRVWVPSSHFEKIHSHAYGTSSRFTLMRSLRDVDRNAFPSIRTSFTYLISTPISLVFRKWKGLKIREKIQLSKTVKRNNWKLISSSYSTDNDYCYEQRKISFPLGNFNSEQ